MSTIVKDALATFFFNEGEQSLIHWQADNDFQFTGEPILSRHLLWNLLKNALRIIEESGKGEIFIWLESDDKHNYLHFKDTAKGMPAEVAAHVFDQFYTKSEGGTGLGLSFCQTVMYAYGGEITCVSEEGKYAQFTLTFPKQPGN